MATLVYRWPCDDGSGDSCRETVGGTNELAITTVDGYPTWEAGGGLCFGTAVGSTSFTGATNLPRAKSTEDSTCLTGRDPIALSVWVNMAGLTTSRPLFGVLTSEVLRNDYLRFQQVIYIGTTGKPAYGFEVEENYSSLNRHEITAADSVAGTEDWHHILAWQNNAVLGSGFTAKLYVDGSLEGTYTATATEGQPGTSYPRFKMGSGLLRDSLMTDYYANTTTTGSNGAFGGILRDARVYSGALTDQEVEDIYNAGPGGAPAVPNQMMFSCNT